MKRVLVFLLAAALGHALERGRDYEKDKVCKEITSLGKDDFTSLSLVLYSRKFPSGTFEQVSQLVKEVVSLTEACCAEGADPDCYDTRTSALSVKSCESDSPFPVHPGTAECCTKEGLERKLCMAALKHPPQEFPTYVEPTNDEICEAFRKDPKGFADQYTFELSRRTHIPEVFLSKVLEPTLKSLGECCDLEDPTACLKAKGPLLKKELSSFIGKGQELCADYSENTFTEYKKNVHHETKKTETVGKLTNSFLLFSHLIKLAQKVPTADLENVLPLAEEITNILSKCCQSTSEDCMAKELPEYTIKICDNLSTKNSKFGDCCQEKTPMDIFMCTYFMPAAQPPELPDVELPTNKDVCDQGSTKATDQLAERLRAKLPDATPAELDDLVDKRSDFASKCCSINSPPLYCDSQIDAEMTNALQS
ncbi:PREDICTED: vitamin D-binding protein [Propithecus coquereli]|uniref:vitamin D-binding protein n=1 Tax=Propithecus coquereli TaxID=379532 RepID=UPI00063F0903|nr:PREDICTED: vitamin D-binding protein [Propithecus coquereli]